MKDNLYSSFTFGKDEFIEFRKVIRSGTGRWRPGVDYKEYDALPIEERWSARFFEVEKVFAPFDTENALEIKVDNYWNIGCWHEYKLFMAGTVDMNIRRPTKSILINQTYKPIAESYLEDDEQEEP
jgi:hypothetical protein